MSLISHPLTYGADIKAFRFDPKHNETFWCETSKLTPVIKALQNNFENLDPAISKLLSLVETMYYDLYNNGGGNGHRWSITKEYRKTLTAAKFDKDIKAALIQRMSDVHVFVTTRHREYGWPVCGHTSNLQLAMEQLMSDLVYFCAMKEMPEEIEALKAAKAA